MRDPIIERASWATRHDFDSLPAGSDIEVRPALESEVSTLAEMAHRLVPGVQIGVTALQKYFAFDPECILTFSRNERLLGAVAFLFLNSDGHDALILDDISLTHPDVGLLARSHEEVSAIYIWALATMGRGIAGYGKVAAHLRGPRYVNANCFAQPSTKAGRDWLNATCFKPIPSFQRELWCYERPWNRPQSQMPAWIVSSRSFADARH